MAIVTGLAGTVFDAANFGLFQGGATEQVGEYSRALGTVQLFTYAVVPGSSEPDYLVGQVDYAVALPVPPSGVQVTYSGLTTAVWTDAATGVVATVTDAFYEFTVFSARFNAFSGLVNRQEQPFQQFRGDDTVNLADGDDNFYDPDGRLFIELGGGDDTLAALGEGGDTIFGGDGNDLIQIQNTGHQIHGGDGDDTITGLGWNGIDDGPSTLEGGAGNDIINGTATTNLFLEGENSGDDQINGSEGDDTVDYSAVASAITVNFDTVTGGSGNDRLQYIDHIIGTGFDDYLGGQFAFDFLEGGAGNDTLVGRTGGDVLDGGDGIDLVDYADDNIGVVVNLTTGKGQRGDAEQDRLTGIENVSGGVADDRLTGDAGANWLGGGQNGKDRLYGLDGDDALYGFVKADKLYGGTGNDTVNGGLGRDLLFGGDGDDHFVYASHVDSPVERRDAIFDFGQVTGNRDVIDLSLADANTTTPGVDDAFVLTADGGIGRFTGVAGQVRYLHVGDTTVIRLDVNGDGASDAEIALKGVFTLTDADFIL